MWRLVAFSASFCATYAAAECPHDGVRGTHLADGVGYVTALRRAHADGAARPLLIAFERAGRSGIPIYESRDDGAHWHLVTDVVDQAHGGDARWQLRWQPHLSELRRASGDLATGTLLLAANATGDEAHGRIVGEDLQVYVSTDSGRSWRYRSSIVTGGGAPEAKDNRGVWEPYLVVLDDGRLVAYYSSEQHKARGYNQLLAHKVSADGGRHWGDEVVDVAIAGGVERPGMAIIERLPDHRYVMSYELIDGVRNGQVYLKFSRDGLDWGDPGDRGTPVSTAAGAWPAASPVVRWLPSGDAAGVLVIAAERAGGDGDAGGRTLYWNNDLGRGPWWQLPAPVQKSTGNIHAGWTQALLGLDGDRLLQISSSSCEPAADAERNELLYAFATPTFNRYEAEDAARVEAVQIGDASASNTQKLRIAAAPRGRATFALRVARAGAFPITLRFATLSEAAVPQLGIDGARQPAAEIHADSAGWSTATFDVALAAGHHALTVEAAGYALDLDYLELGAPR